MKSFMKMKTFILFVSFLCAGFLSLSVFSANNTLINVTSTILSNINVTKDRDLSFVTGTTSAGGSFTVAPELVSANGTSAELTVTGEAGNNFTISIDNPSITLTGPGSDITVDNFTFAVNGSAVGPQSIPGAGTFTGASIILFIGATETLNANQAAGTYTAATNPTVTIAYPT